MPNGKGIYNGFTEFVAMFDDLSFRVYLYEESQTDFNFISTVNNLQNSFVSYVTASPS